jgi:CRISPR system Cascade subunit CasE
MSGMFLSRARLRADSAVRAIAPLLLPQDGPDRLLAAHRLVWSLMSDEADRTRDFLWREEQQGAFLILAPRPAAANGGLFDVQSKPWEPNLRAGDRLGFLLRANPTVARSAGPGLRGKRHDVVMDALRNVAPGERAAARREVVVTAGRDWLTRQGARAGFVPDEDVLRIDGYDSIRIPRGERDAVEFGRLEFEGVLEVTDPSTLLATVTGGFGRARVRLRPDAAATGLSRHARRRRPWAAAAAADPD